MLDRGMYILSRVYGVYGMKAQKFSLVNPKGLPGKLKFMWHAYRALLAMVLVCALMLFLQNLVIFWCAFAAIIAGLYIKGILEEKLDAGIGELLRGQKDDDPEPHPS